AAVGFAIQHHASYTQAHFRFMAGDRRRSATGHPETHGPQVNHDDGKVRTPERGKPRYRRAADREAFTQIITQRRGKRWKRASPSSRNRNKRMVRRAGVEPARPLRAEGFKSLA